MTRLEALFRSDPLFLLPGPIFIALYILDLLLIFFAVRLISRRTFAYGYYTFSFALTSFSDILLYFTDRSPVNAYATGDFFYPRYMTVIDGAFVLTSIGYLIFVLTIRFGSRPFKKVSHGLISNALALSLRSNSIGFVLVAGQMLLLLLLIAAGVSLFSARASGFENTATRPLTVVAAYLATFSLTIFFTRLFLRRSIINITLLSVSVLFCLTLGVRSAIFTPLMFFIFLNAWWVKSKNFLKYLLYLLAVFPLVQLAELFRTKAGSAAALGVDAIIASVFYGNSFSDLRDFSWILSGWDGSLLWGKTYIAGLLGFVPSFVFPLRQAWNWGPISLQLSGLYVSDPKHEHPGLRGTFIAEAYVNFGLFGLAAMAVIYGLFFMYDYVGVREAVDRRDKFDFAVRLVRYQYVIWLVDAAVSTPSVSFAYFLILMMLFIHCLKKF